MSGHHKLWQNSDFIATNITQVWAEKITTQASYVEEWATHKKLICQLRQKIIKKILGKGKPCVSMLKQVDG